jgi:Tfp pilus assembly PilM family ATPase
MLKEFVRRFKILQDGHILYQQKLLLNGRDFDQLPLRVFQYFLVLNQEVVQVSLQMPPGILRVLLIKHGPDEHGHQVLQEFIILPLAQLNVDLNVIHHIHGMVHRVLHHVLPLICTMEDVLILIVWIVSVQLISDHLG